MEGKGIVVAKKAPDFSLKDQDGKTWTLNDIIKDSPAILAFYPGDFTPICTKQLCDYRDSIEDFKSMGIRIVGISANTVDSHSKFAEKYQFQFPLLSDPEKEVTRAYGCTSFLMFGQASRAICIVNKKGLILYRYVEPTVLTRRSAQELVLILRDLKENSIL